MLARRPTVGVLSRCGGLIALIACVGLVTACVSGSAAQRDSGAVAGPLSAQPAAITAVYAYRPEGPYIVGDSDGTVRCIDESGSVRWTAPNAGMTVAGISASDNASAALTLVSLSSAAPGGTDAVRVFDDAGHAKWEALAAPGRPIDARLSSDGRSVLVLRSADSPGPTRVSVRDSATGVVQWEKEVRDAPVVAADASTDLRSIVVGYVIQPPGQGEPTGLIESYRDGAVVSSMPRSVPSIPALIGTDGVAFAGYDGAIEGRAWADGSIGAKRWHANGEGAGIVASEGENLVVATYQRTQSQTGTAELTTVAAYDSDGKLVVRREFRASAPYLPALSRDGRLLALIPRAPRNNEAPLILSLGQRSGVATLPVGVTAIDFGAGGGRMFVGRSDGTWGVERVPTSAL